MLFLRVMGVMFVVGAWLEAPHVFRLVAPETPRAPRAGSFRALQIAGGVMLAFEATTRLLERVFPAMASMPGGLPVRLGQAMQLTVAGVALMLAIRHARSPDAATRSFALGSAAIGGAILSVNAILLPGLAFPWVGRLVLAMIGFGVVSVGAYWVGLRRLYSTESYATPLDGVVERTRHRREAERSRR